jgi:hypothetical protein
MSNGIIRAFAPSGTVGIAASTTSTNVTLAGGGPSVLIYNATSAIAFVKLGASSSLAASAAIDYPVPPGGARMIDGGPYVTVAAAVLASGSGIVYFSNGDGTAF